MTEAFGGRGGVAQYNRDFLTALASSGCVAGITVMPLVTPEQEAVPDGITQLKPRRGRTLYTAAALARAANGPTDLVFCGHVHLAPVASAAAGLRGAKLVMQAHGVDVWKRPNRLWRAAIERSDLILCVSRHTRGAVLDLAAVAPERVRVIPNTVRDEFVPGDGMAFRRRHGLLDRKVILTVGRLDARERYKGHDRVIALLPDLVAQGLDVIYVIGGSGDDQPRLQTLAREKGMADRVLFLGELHSEQLVDAYRAADLFVMASTGEGFGISFLESMACGTPAVGLNVAGARDALADGELGTLVDEAQLGSAVSKSRSLQKSEAAQLAVRVRARFGRELFNANVRAALAHI